MTREIGLKLKQLRKNKKLSQQEVADKVDISRSTISNYEIGRRTPHLKDLQRFADLYGVGLDFFGISAKDEAFDLLARAKAVFESSEVTIEEKEELYHEFMKLYLKVMNK